MTMILGSAPIVPARPRRRGWGGSVVLDGLRRPLDTFLPVLALSVVRPTPAGGTEILVGVRDPRTNSTHQNVTSVPTRRVPRLLAARWRGMLRSGSRETGESYEGLRDQVHSIFSCKLGLADPLERGELDVRLGAVGACQGISVIGEQADGSPITEELTMFNAEVVLASGSNLVPATTASYSTLVWVDVRAFAEMVRSRDAGRLAVGLENAFVCAYGLCLQTSLSMIERVDLAADRAAGTALIPHVADAHREVHQLELFTPIR